MPALIDERRFNLRQSDLGQRSTHSLLGAKLKKIRPVRQWNVETSVRTYRRVDHPKSILGRGIVPHAYRNTSAGADDPDHFAQRQCRCWDVDDTVCAEGGIETGVDERQVLRVPLVEFARRDTSLRLVDELVRQVEPNGVSAALHRGLD